MTCREIIENYLKENGFDGLFGDECACSLGDLIQCGDACGDCQPGYEYEVMRGEPCKNCEDDCPFPGDMSDFNFFYFSENMPVKCRKRGATVNTAEIKEANK